MIAMMMDTKMSIKIIQNRKITQLEPNYRKVERLKDDKPYREYYLFTDEQGDDHYHKVDGPADIEYDEDGNVKLVRYRVFGEEPNEHQMCLIQLNEFFRQYDYVSNYSEDGMITINNKINNDVVYMTNCRFDEIGRKVAEFLE